MKKFTVTLSIVLLTVLGSFQDAHAMGGARKFAQGLLRARQSIRAEDVAVVGAGIAFLTTGAFLYRHFDRVIGGLLLPLPPTDEERIKALSKMSIDDHIKDIHGVLDKERTTDSKASIRKLYTEDHFNSLIKRDTAGRPHLSVNSLTDFEFIRITQEIEGQGTVTLPVDDSTITLRKEHLNDIRITYLEELEKHLVKVRDTANALDKSVQKQVLMLEGIAQ